MKCQIDLVFRSNQNKQQKIENKNKTEHKLTCSLPRPSYCEAQPTQPSASRRPPLDRRTRGRVPTARRHAPATSCLPARRWRHPRAPRTPLNPSGSLSLSLCSSPPSVSFSRERPSAPSPPTSTTAPRATASPRRCAPKLRLDPLFLPTESHPAKRPEASPPTSSPSFGRRDRRRPPVFISSSPTSPTRSS